MGYLLDRVGAVVLPVVATFAVVSGSILTTLVDVQWQLFMIFLFLFGFLGRGSLYAPLMANISKWYDRRRGMAVGSSPAGKACLALSGRQSSPQPSPKSDGATVLSGLASLRGSSCCPCA